MDDWHCQYSLPHTAATPQCGGQNLDFGRTVPLTHAPVHIHQVTGQFTNVNNGYFNGNHSYGRMTNNTSAPSYSTHDRQHRNIKSQSQKKGNQSEKKRWQTADFRWMFTKRKGELTLCRW